MLHNKNAAASCKTPVKVSEDGFASLLGAQGLPEGHVAFVCPACGTLQSEASLIHAGASDAEAACETGFTCEGSFGNHRRGCGYHLEQGNHTMEIHDSLGGITPIFAPASPAMARLLAVSLGHEPCD